MTVIDVVFDPTDPQMGSAKEMVHGWIGSIVAAEDYDEMTEGMGQFSISGELNVDLLKVYMYAAVHASGLVFQCLDELAARDPLTTRQELWLQLLERQEN